jgi:hypothetical protein
MDHSGRNGKILLGMKEYVLYVEFGTLTYQFPNSIMTSELEPTEVLFFKEGKKVEKPEKFNRDDLKVFINKRYKY